MALTKEQEEWVAAKMAAENAEKNLATLQAQADAELADIDAAHKAAREAWSVKWVTQLADAQQAAKGIEAV
jgi:hypothetical protein